MRYKEFRYLVEGYPQAQAAFIQAGADPQSVRRSTGFGYLRLHK
jgi:hypothetical protein